MSQTATLPVPTPGISTSPVTPAQAQRLFVASCVALTSSAMMFAIGADIRGALKEQFILSNELVGWIASAGLGFTISIIALGPLCDALGMRLIIRLAILCHTVGLLLTIFATGAWMLFLGGLIHAFGGGSIEAACNPLIATIYPDRKTHKLNQFHMWFPGGIVIGGLICYGLNQLAPDLWQGLHVKLWQVKVAAGLVPTAAYALLMIGLRFPPTERVAAGVSFGGMIRETLCRPLFLVLLGCMMLTASLELGPQGWIPAVFTAGDLPGIAVLTYITVLMAILRFFAGPVVRTLGNIGVLLLSSLLAGTGLLLLSWAHTLPMVLAAATVFALGVCYFWPTMLGTAAERVPKGGALALSILGGVGGLFVALVTTPQMGRIADLNVHYELVAKVSEAGQTVDREALTLAALQRAAAAYGDWAQTLLDTPRDRIMKGDVDAVQKTVEQVAAARTRLGHLPRGETTSALRTVIRNGPPGKADDATLPAAQRAAVQARGAVEQLLKPAENRGGLVSFRWVAPLSLVLIVVFGILWLRDRAVARGPGGLSPERPSGGA